MAVAYPYHIVLKRKDQILLSFLKIKAVVNGKEIYPLINSKPVVIPVEANNPKIVITDGFHITRPLKLIYNDLPVYCFNVECAVGDYQLMGGFLILVILYLTGFYSGLLLLKVVSFLPIVLLLFIYYSNRKDFLRLIPVLN